MLVEVNNMKPYYVVGHKNPDCDSIVSAIAYAQLKNELGEVAVARAQGNPNPETKYLLNKYKFKQPPIIYSAKCTLADIEKDEAVLVRSCTTMKDALDLVMTRKNRGVFVTDAKGHLEGVVSVSDLTQFYTKSEADMSKLIQKASLDNIVHVLKAKIYHSIEDFHSNGRIHVMPALSDARDTYQDSIVILRNNPDIQRYMIDAKAALLVICGEDWIDNVTLQLAKEKKVAIIHTELSVLECSRVIFQSPSVSEVETKDVISFRLNETVEEVSNQLAKTRFRTYPVLNEEGIVVAAISRYHLFHYEKKKFILVDHNEESQTVNDIEYGIISEIVDHHRMGGIETTNPINITSRVIGSTSTIIASLYGQHQIPIDPNMAGLLLGGIINDTLCLKSPTTTKEDYQQVEILSKIAGISADELNNEMIEASDSILKKTNLELMYDDFKEFRIGESRIGIGQSQCKDWKDYFKIRSGFLAYLNEAVIQQKYDLILILFTDPAGSGSYFLYTGKKSWVVKEGFADILTNDGYAEGIISRKKQVLPVIMQTMTQ